MVPSLASSMIGALRDIAGSLAPGPDAGLTNRQQSTERANATYTRTGMGQNLSAYQAPGLQPWDAFAAVLFAVTILLMLYVLALRPPR